MKKYIAVLYRTNGNMNVSKPYNTEEECIEALKEAVFRHPNDFAATTYMVREVADEPQIQFLFGHPKSRDILQNKKIMRELEQRSMKND